MASGGSPSGPQLGKPLKKKQVMRRLEDMFGSLFDWNLIYSVALQSEWNLHVAAEKLLLMSETGSSFHLRQFPTKMSATPGKGPEQHKSPQKFSGIQKNFPDKKSIGTVEQKRLLPANRTSRHENITVPVPQSVAQVHRPVKVAYQGMHRTEDLDDVDVVIEEETEFEIIGGVIVKRDGCGRDFQSSGHLYSQQPLNTQNIARNVMPGETNRVQLHSQQIQIQRPARMQQKPAKCETGKNNEVAVKNPVERIRMHIQNGTRILILLRGLPGSGKSYLASHMVKTTVSGNFREYVFSADDYFVRRNGQYVYEPARVSEAHEWVRNNVEDKMKKGESPIFIDNTNIQSWEMKPYAVFAVNYGYVLEVIEPLNPWRYVESKLAQKNVHGVPQHKIREMLQRFEPQLTGKSLLKLFKLSYHPTRQPPQPAAQKSLSARTEKKATQVRTRKKKVKMGDVNVSQGYKKLNNGRMPELQIRNELKDILTLYFAKKLQEQGKKLDLKMGKTQLSSGLTIEDILTAPVGSKEGELKSVSQAQRLLDGLTVSKDKQLPTQGGGSHTSSVDKVGNTFGLFGIGSNSSSENETTEDSSDSDTDECSLEQWGSDWEDLEDGQLMLTELVDSLDVEGDDEVLTAELCKCAVAGEATGCLSESDGIVEGTSLKVASNTIPSTFSADVVNTSRIQASTIHSAASTGIPDTDTSSNYIGVLESTGSRGGTPEISVPHCDLPVNGASYSGTTQVNIASTALADVSVAHGEMPDFGVPHSEMPDVCVPHSEMPDVCVPRSEMPDVGVPCSEMPNVNTMIIDLLETYAAAVDVDDAYSGVPEFGATHSVTSDINLVKSDLMKNDIMHSDSSKTSAASSGMPNINDAHCNDPNIGFTFTNVLEINAVLGNTLEINQTSLCIPEFTAIPSGSQEKSTIQSSMLETDMIQDGISGKTSSPSDMLEIKNTHSGMPHIEATYGDSPDVLTTHSEVPEVCSTNIVVLKVSDTEHGLSGVISDHNDLPNSPDCQKKISQNVILKIDCASQCSAPAIKTTHSCMSGIGGIQSDVPEISIVHSDVPEISIVHSDAPEISIVHSDASEISIVHSDASEISIVHSDASEISTVISDVPEISTVISDPPEITIIHNDVLEITTVHSDMPDICTIPDDVPDISTVHSDMPDISTIHSDVPDVSTVHSDAPEIITVHSDVPEISALHSDVPDISTIHSDVPDVSTVHSDAPEIITIHSDVPEISALHSDVPEISTVHGNVPESSTLHGDVPEISTIHGDMPEICAVQNYVLQATVTQSSMLEANNTKQALPITDDVQCNMFNNTTTYSNMSEVVATLIGFSDTNATCSGSPEKKVVCNDMSDVATMYKAVPETVSCSAVPEIRATHNARPVVSASCSGVPDMGAANGDCPDICTTYTEMPDICASQNSMMEIHQPKTVLPNAGDNQGDVFYAFGTLGDVTATDAADIGEGDALNSMLKKKTRPHLSEISTISSMPVMSIALSVGPSRVHEVSGTHWNALDTVANQSNMSRVDVPECSTPEMSAVCIGITKINSAEEDTLETTCDICILPEVTTECVIPPEAVAISPCDSQLESFMHLCNEHTSVSDESRVGIHVAPALLLDEPAASDLVNVGAESPVHRVSSEKPGKNETNESNLHNRLCCLLEKRAVGSEGPCGRVELVEENKLLEELPVTGSCSSNCEVLGNEDQKSHLQQAAGRNSRQFASSCPITNEEMEQWVTQLKQDLTGVTDYKLATVQQDTEKDIEDVSLECSVIAGGVVGTVENIFDHREMNEKTELSGFEFDNVAELDKCDVSKWVCELIATTAVSSPDHIGKAAVSRQVDGTHVTLDGVGSISVSSRSSVVCNGAPVVDVCSETTGRTACLLEQQFGADAVIEECENKNGKPLLNSKGTEPDDTWHIWEENTPWRVSEGKPEVPRSSLEADVPKPARQLKRERVLTSAVVRGTNVPEHPAVVEAVGDWQPVAGADVSWQSENNADFVSLDTLLSEVPRPQRKRFESDKSADKRVLKLPDNFGSLSDKRVMRRTENLSHLQKRDGIDENDCCSRWQQAKVSAEASTNTQSTDFLVARLIESNDKNENIHELHNVKVFSYSGQYISGNSFPDLQSTRNVPNILMLDKSSMTGEDSEYSFPTAFAGDMEVKKSFEQLTRVFSHIPRDQLTELFEKCKGDVNWTAEMLLDSGYEPHDFDVSVDEVNDGRENEASSAPEDANAERFLPSLVSNGEAVDRFVLSLAPEDTAAGRFAHELGAELPIVSTPKLVDARACVSKKNGRSGLKTKPSAEALELKKHFERNIRFDSCHYSEHVQRIKRIRHGELVEMGDVTSSAIPEPSAPPAEDVGGGELQFEVLPGGEPVMVDSVSMLDGTSFSTSSDAEVAGDVAVRRPTEEELEAQDQASDEEQDVWLPLTLDRQFVDVLHALFGNPAVPFPPDMEPVVNIPLSLARQLHCYLMDAQQSRAEQQSRQDEELARKLQHQERETGGGVADLREIMDMELALSLYRADLDKSNTETRDDMATRLTKLKLVEVFPEVDEEVLGEVLRAHDYSFSETCDVLQASMAGGQEDRVRNVFTPEALAHHERHLLQQAQLESAKNLQVGDPPVPPDDDCDAKDRAMQDANHFRAEAARHAKLRLECSLKASEAFRRKLYTVALYYSQVAELHMRYVDDANARAASSLLTHHSLSHFTTTLDLHFLQVTEALQVLDMFLDAHVSYLQEQGKRGRRLYIITGWGAHSAGRRARLRPAVMHHLREKGLRFHQNDNPGLLTVYVLRNTPLSADS